MATLTHGRHGDFITWRLDAKTETVVLGTPIGAIRIAYDDLHDVLCALEAAEDGINGVEYPEDDDEEETV